MSFRITGLSPEPFRHLFGLPDEVLAAHGAQRWTATPGSRLPDRVEVRDAEPGETLLLVNYAHQPAETPYRATHAIFVREGATAPCEFVDAIPEAMRSRMLSLRAFDGMHFMADAELVDGRDAEAAIARLFAEPRVAYIPAHYATRGCYAARVDRA
jgi:hypothetical protein